MKAVIFLSLCALAIGANQHYGAEVLRVVPKTRSQGDFLQNLHQQGKYDFWSIGNTLDHNVDIMAEKGQVSELKGLLERFNLNYNVINSDVGLSIEKHLEENQKARAKYGERMDWVSYHTYDEINAWMEELAVSYPNRVSVTDVGTSYEGRTMKMLKISSERFPEGAPESIFVDGGIHAREWISPATVTYMMNQFIQDNIDYGVDLYFMPVINPDGYDYTFTNSRLWRKTRSPNAGTNCIGTDPNRNWDFHWMEIGASNNPCDATYAGSVPFSEIEMQVVRDQILATNPSAYLTFHAYSQMWMYPWGWTAALPDDWQDLDALAQTAVAELTALYGTQYEIGSSTNVIYAAAGGSDDWAKGVAGVKYSYTIELRDTGTFGFLLPTSQIIPSGEETYLAFQEYLKFFQAAK